MLIFCVFQVFASMVATFGVNVLLSAFHGHPADLSNPGLISFGKFSVRLFTLLVFIHLLSKQLFQLNIMNNQFLNKKIISVLSDLKITTNVFTLQKNKKN